VAPGVQSSAFHIGRNVFRSDNRSEPVFLGQTGAKPGTRTSSVTGDVWLTITYDGSNYKLSIDDGASYTIVPTDGAPNQAVTDSQTDRVLYVDTTGITGTGVEPVRVPGTYDIFNTLISIRDILRNEKGLPDAQLQELLNKSMLSLEEVNNLLVQSETSIGSQIGFLDDLKDSLKNIKYDTEDKAAALEDADIAQIAMDLSRRQVLYQMSLQIGARIMSMSLLDFIT